MGAITKNINIKDNIVITKLKRDFLIYLNIV